MFHGMINVYKEPGYTSHDVVARLRGILKQKRIGHTGTLDPAAEGVLPVCLGVGTRLCELLTDRDKAYRAVLLLGKETDTQDTTGRVTRDETEKAMALSDESIRQAAEGFLGAYDQVPPMYSALKVQGKKLYELARQGKTVEREPRRVWIHEIQVEEIRLPRVVLTVNCSKGTYIRTLCEDMGRVLDCGGCMEHLTRTRAAGFGLDRPVLQITPQFWQRMHEDEFSALNFTEAEDLLSLSKCNEVCRRFLNGYLNYPLQTLKPFGLSDEDLPAAPVSQEAEKNAQDSELAELVPARAQ